MESVCAMFDLLHALYNVFVDFGQSGTKTTTVVDKTHKSDGSCIWSVSHGVRGSGSVKPSPPRPRESAQCILDVINLEPEPVNEGEVEDSEIEDKMLGALCRS